MGQKPRQNRGLPTKSKGEQKRDLEGMDIQAGNRGLEVGSGKWRHFKNNEKEIQRIWLKGKREENQPEPLWELFP